MEPGYNKVSGASQSTQDKQLPAASESLHLGRQEEPRTLSEKATAQLMLLRISAGASCTWGVLNS